MEQAIIIENKEKLKDRVAACGFGRRFDGQIDANFSKGLKEFKLNTSESIEGRVMEFELDINSKETKGYFNGYRATLNKENEQPVQQWFKSTDRITINEAYCLLLDQENPRAVYKTLYDDKGEQYNTWLQINFHNKTESGNHEMKRFHDKYGSGNLLEKLNDFAFIELTTLSQKLDATNRMKEGREIELSPVNQEKYQSVLVRANPEKRTIAIMDTDGNFLSHNQFRTEEAKARIQEEKNRKYANVSFVDRNNNNQEKVSQGEQSDKSTTNTPLPPPDKEVKKNASEDTTEQLNPNRRKRVIREDSRSNRSRKSV